LNALRHKKTYEQMFETQATRFARCVASFHCHTLTSDLRFNGQTFQGPARRSHLSDKCDDGKILLR
jgi:hypothetical protein